MEAGLSFAFLGPGPQEVISLAAHLNAQAVESGRQIGDIDHKADVVRVVPAKAAYRGTRRPLAIARAWVVDACVYLRGRWRRQFPSPPPR